MRIANISLSWLVWVSAASLKVWLSPLSNLPPFKVRFMMKPIIEVFPLPENILSRPKPHFLKPSPKVCHKLQPLSCFQHSFTEVPMDSHGACSHSRNESETQLVQQVCSCSCLSGANWQCEYTHMQMHKQIIFRD